MSEEPKIIEIKPDERMQMIRHHAASIWSLMKDGQEFCFVFEKDQSIVSPNQPPPQLGLLTVTRSVMRVHSRIKIR